MNKRKKQKGYVLIVVMIFAFALASLAAVTFGTVVRYQTQSAKKIKELQEKVNPTSDNTSDTDARFEIDDEFLLL